MASAIRNPDATYTLTLTAREQAVAAKIGAGLVTQAKVIEAIVERKLREAYLQYRDREADGRQLAYDAATPANQATADSAIGFDPEAV
jgi:hypothetical protein